MNKFILATTLVVSIPLISSCTVTEAAYTPGYVNDNIYAVGYQYQPYWGNRYYSNYTLNNRYWYGNGYRRIYGGYHGVYTGPVYRGWGRGIHH